MIGERLLTLVRLVIRREKEMEAVKNQVEELNLQLVKLAREDSLTGLENRRMLMDRLHLEYGRGARDKEWLTAVMLDVDFFKLYNDTYGHSAGDDCLQRVADILANGVARVVDTAARYGGEEFCLLLPNTKAEGGLQLAERILQTLYDANIPHSESSYGRVTLSAGVYSCIPDLNVSPEEMLQKADKALYKAKTQGRNRVCLHVESGRE